MNRKLLAVLPIALVVIASGCTTLTGGGTGSVATGPGVVVQDWKPDFSKLYSGEQLALQLRIQNQGQTRARNVVAEVTGIDLADWGTGGFTNYENLGDLIPADAVSNTPGETRTVQFQNLRAPALAKGTSFAYTPVARVSYDYATTAHKPITIVDQNELRRIQQQGRTLPSKATTYTAGPLAVEIRTGNYVKTGTGFGQTYDIFPVYIKVTNTQWEQGGTVVPKGFLPGSSGYGFGTIDQYPVLVKVTPPAGTTFVFSGFGQDDCSSFQVTKDLWQGKDAEITCELQVTSPPSIAQEKLITVELDYRYFAEAKATVTVDGTAEPGQFGTFY
ncbi:MAG TPA: hypothetical protein VJB16_05620 [archaeon]|nr:hypothetical protein [archaeon]